MYRTTDTMTIIFTGCKYAPYPYMVLDNNVYVYENGHVYYNDATNI